MKINVVIMRDTVQFKDIFGVIYKNSTRMVLWYIWKKMIDSNKTEFSGGWENNFDEVIWVWAWDFEVDEFKRMWGIYQAAC